MYEGSLNTDMARAEVDFRREQVRRSFADLTVARKTRVSRRAARA
ncbi:MAG: hypothetical protein ACI379_10275 [Nocardioides sp.]